MPAAIQFPNEDRSNAVRLSLTEHEPHALRTFTPSLAVFARSAGVFHFTPEGRRLYDYSSGVLVANLGHNPRRWMQRLCQSMGWQPQDLFAGDGPPAGSHECFEAVTLTAYNAMTELEAAATQRLLRSLRASPGGARCEQVMWAASGSEAVQKALWACLHRDNSRDIILATRHGFHGKKGLAGAVTGTEHDPERDPRVKFISFPMAECDDLTRLQQSLDFACFQAELDQLHAEFGRRINCLITEPYLGGGGSYHPQPAYLQWLQDWCRAQDVVFVLDEVQSNFGRTGPMYAFEKYGIEPDLVVLGKGMGNGIPVSAAAGRADLMASLNYGAASDTWSANPLACAAVLATLDEFESTDVLGHAARLSEVLATGLLRLKETGLIIKVRGEGMVFGIECGPAGGLSAGDVAVEIIRSCYLGDGETGIHLLGALAGTVLRVSPPLTMSLEEAEASLALLQTQIERVARQLGVTPSLSET